MNLNLLGKLFTIIFLVILTGCGAKKQDKRAANKRPVPRLDGYIVKTETFSETIQVPGSLRANEVTEIHPEVSGRVVSLNAREGQFVNKGAVLAKIYDEDLQAQLRKLKVQLEIAQANEKRASQLLDIQGISKQDYDATVLNSHNIRADLDIVRAAITKTIVRAPFSGKMGLKDISPGAYVTPATVIATINQTNNLKLDFSVPEKYTRSIYKGQVVNFKVEGNDRNYAARIMATESNVTVSNRSLEIRAMVTGNAEGLLPGTFASVMVEFSPRSNVIFVPTQSIIPTARGKQIILYNSGKAVFNNVETGTRDSARLEITSGLKGGDTILVTGMMSTKPNDPILIDKIIN